MSLKPRIMCVDDNELIASAMERWIAESGEFVWVGAVTDVGEVIGAVRRWNPTIVLLDIDMPGANAFSTLRGILEAAPETRVVMFSGHVHRELIEKSIDSGAWGYISKSDGMNAVVESLRAVASGEFVLSPEVEAEAHRPVGPDSDGKTSKGVSALHG